MQGGSNGEGEGEGEGSGEGDGVGDGEGVGEGDSCAQKEHPRHFVYVQYSSFLFSLHQFLHGSGEGDGDGVGDDGEPNPSPVISWSQALKPGAATWA